MRGNPETDAQSQPADILRMVAVVLYLFENVLPRSGAATRRDQFKIGCEMISEEQERGNR